MPVVPLPGGGTATFRDKLVSERQNRILETSYAVASPAMVKTRGPILAWAATEMGVEDPASMTPEQLDQAQELVSALSSEEQSAIVGDPHFTREEAASMLDLQDAGIVAFLENWSLKRPLPTIEDVQDLPRDLYKVLSDTAKPLITANVVTHEDFSPQPGLENPTDGSSLSSDTPSLEPVPSQ